MTVNLVILPNLTQFSNVCISLILTDVYKRDILME